MAKFLSVLGLILVGVLGLVGAVTFSLRFTGTTLSDLAPASTPKLENPITNKPKLERIVGKGKVLDGDTIEISGRRIRLFGIDAPENGQTCTINGNHFAVIKPPRLRWPTRLALTWSNVSRKI